MTKEATLKRSHVQGGLRLIVLGFGAIISMFLVATYVGIFETRRIEASNALIVENMLTSIDLVSRLVRDVDQKQVLINDHVYERQPGAMIRIESRIAALDEDYAATARAYQPLVSTPDEPATWTKFEEQVASLEKPINLVIAYSRQNDDVAARGEMVAVDAQFRQVDQLGAELIRINHENAGRVAREVETQHGRTIMVLWTCGIAGALVSVLVALWVTFVLVREARASAKMSGLEERNEELDAFAGRIAHDLRGPLTTISIAASQLSKHAPAEERMNAVLDRGVTRMGALIQDLLTLSRVGSDMQIVDCDPSIVARSVEEESVPRLKAEGGTLTVAVEPAMVRCSEGLLHQAFSNLVDNAVKYRRKDVPVEVEIGGHAQGDVYELRVRDNGIGMAPEDAQRAFEPFYRAARSKDRPGTGLGLSIVRRVVEASGGTIAIDSEADRGTSIVIHLPLAGQEQDPGGPLLS